MTEILVMGILVLICLAPLIVIAINLWLDR